MYWLDVAIIYFALGAPFGVLRITAKRKVTPFAYLRMASGYLLWPLVAVRNAARYFIAKPTAHVTQTSELDAIRNEIEKIAFSDATATEVYVFREIFNRYTGLAEAVNAQLTVPNAQSRGFDSSLINHNPSVIRAACLRRRDLKKIESQLVIARQDIVENLRASKMTEREQVATLANYLGDKTLAKTVYSR